MSVTGCGLSSAELENLALASSVLAGRYVHVRLGALLEPAEYSCEECLMAASGSEAAIVHAAHCNVGQVRGLLTKLLAGVAHDNGPTPPAAPADPVCPHCGPSCRGGAAHNARAEDGVFYESFHEPWRVTPQGPGHSGILDVELCDSMGSVIASLISLDQVAEGREEPTLQRIALCVNYCAGLSDAEIVAAQGFADRLQDGSALKHLLAEMAAMESPLGHEAGEGDEHGTEAPGLRITEAHEVLPGVAL